MMPVQYNAHLPLLAAVQLVLYLLQKMNQLTE